MGVGTEPAFSLGKGPTKSGKDAHVQAEMKSPTLMEVKSE